ncbi:MAG TPA: PEP-CTERM sorting domain-containing protein [Vicinamibacterales bacterium]|nr:PEP-CTERM sorting domain-containing protein [Vicinamibacterales bacterium]
MKQVLPLGLALWLGFAPGAAADPIFNTAHLVTSGVFGCFDLTPCSASGSRVTLGVGDSAVTLMFTGVTTTVPVTNEALPITIGTLAAFSSGASTFPASLNPNVPVMSLALTLAHTTPVPDSATLRMGFGPGGGTELQYMQGGTYWVLDPGPVPPGYGPLVYSLSPHPFSVPLNGSVAITADAGVVPEPGTMLLVASGLLLGYQARKRRRRG